MKEYKFAWQVNLANRRRNLFAELSEKLGYDKMYTKEEWLKIKRLSSYEANKHN